MKYRIGFIISDQTESQILSQQLFAKEVACGEVLIRNVSHHSKVFDTARELIQQGAQALIARGGNYRDLKKEITTVPVIELTMRISSVLQALKGQLDKYDEIWIVLSDYVRFDFEDCRPFLPEKVHCFRYRPVDEMLRFLETLDAPSNTLIIGTGFVMKPARDRGFHAIQVQNDQSCLLDSYNEARSILLANEKERIKATRSATILSNIEDGVLFLNDKGVITYCNQKATQLLQKSAENLHRQKLGELFPEFSAAWNSYQNGKHGDKIVKVSGHILAIKVSPIADFSEDEAVSGMLVVLRDVTKLQELEKNLRFQMSKKGLTARYHFDDILTQEPVMYTLISWARQCAENDHTVLIYGQSGTGKELFAQSIHNASHRKDAPFVAVNCAALSESLLESELFGYVSGAFTGARKEGKAGLFELAHQGTIFLDEINSMSLSTQAKILRVLEEREVMRLGSDYIIPLDVRIIAAANENLEQLVLDGKFRRDLFFRLDVLELRIPPLNERPNDILYLFQYYAAQMLHESPEEMVLSAALQEALLQHDWWGNVRELRNAAQKYSILGEDAILAALTNKKETAQPALIDDDFRIDLKELNHAVEDMVIESLLNRGLTKTETAKALGISRTALFKKMERNS